ncbi:MAG TPA: M3 family oligoendopeptidase [Symbiobacteriaceae bacterium]|nr:M3 family oligoendopeptidase [Symbiobacteriaceae bacterium]
MTNQYQQKWDLDSIFPGGSKSPDLLTHMDGLEESLKLLQAELDQLPAPDTDAGLSAWHGLLMGSQQLLDRFYQAGAFLSCLSAQDVRDMEAKLLMGRLGQMGAWFGSIEIFWRDRIKRLPEAVWQKLLVDERFAAVAFPLQEMRDRAMEQMPAEQEALANDLSVDGFHAWSRLYQTISGRVTVPFEENGKVERLSAGQAYNKFSHPDPAVRAAIFANWEEAWGEQAELCAAALNHVAGYRLALYRHRGWDSVLKAPMDDNRMTLATLDAMWGAVEGGKDILVAYLKRKAELMGTGAYHWYDENAPLGAASRKVSYDEAAAFIIDQFGRFSPRMANFARNAFAQCWIEAEDRPGKMPGGFCTPLPISRQCRVFLTYGGDAGSVATVAHELGHAFHFDVMWDIPPIARQYAMNVAETASTFAEMLTAKAAIAAAPTREEKIALLDDGVRRAVTMFMNIHSRFLFETRFYEARKKGLLGVDQLGELMVSAQKDAFRGSLATCHKYFWASKGHFYGTGVPFYNFPYTFGFLFSAGIYARAMEEGPAFEQKYVDLLRDTGRMTVEELGRRHLGVDLSRPDFWESAVKIVTADVPTFLEMTR